MTVSLAKPTVNLTHPTRTATTHRRAQVDVRRAFILTLAVLAFMTGLFLGQHTPVDVECDPAEFGCQFEADGMWYVTDQQGVAHPIHEDSPLWDCRTMGNLDCGPTSITN